MSQRLSFSGSRRFVLLTVQARLSSLTRWPSEHLAGRLTPDRPVIWCLTFDLETAKLEVLANRAIATFRI